MLNTNFILINFLDEWISLIQLAKQTLNYLRLLKN